MLEASVSGRKQGWLAWLILIPALAAAMVVGFFVLVVIVGVVVFAAAVLLARLWWLRRKMRKATAGQVLEGEYVVIRVPAAGDRGAARDKDTR
jgi:membrane protein implicated in regulation of membrane protease activity